MVKVHVSASYVERSAGSSGLSGFGGGGEESCRWERKLGDDAERVNSVTAATVNTSNDENLAIFIVSDRGGSTLD